MMPGPGEKPQTVVFPPGQVRPRNVYMVFGWRVDVEQRNVVLYQKGEEAAALGISVTMSADGQKSFLGLHLATMKVVDGEDYVGRAIPTQPEGEELRRTVQALGIHVVDEPMVYVIAA